MSENSFIENIQTQKEDIVPTPHFRLSPFVVLWELWAFSASVGCASLCFGLNLGLPILGVWGTGVAVWCVLFALMSALSVAFVRVHYKKEIRDVEESCAALHGYEDDYIEKKCAHFLKKELASAAEKDISIAFGKAVLKRRASVVVDVFPVQGRETVLANALSDSQEDASDPFSFAAKMSALRV